MVDAGSPASAETAAFVRINAGGSAVTDVNGNAWVADKAFVGGSVGSTKKTVADTDNQGVFRDERYGMSAYQIPVPNGTYEVRLLESEHYFTAAGKRIFSVTSEGATVVRDVDLFTRAGGAYKALWLTFKSTVTDGRLDLGFKASKNYPKVDGIVVVADAAPSPSPSPSPSTDPSPPPSPDPTPGPDPETSELLWGMSDGQYYDSTEQALGRKFAAARVYRRIDQSFVGSRGKSLVDSGHSLVLSVRARTASSYIKYSAITAGNYDSTFVTGLGQLNALATPTYFIFQHEADSTDAKPSCSKPSDSVCGPEFVAAWKHIYNLSKAHGFTNLKFVWTVTSYGFSPQTNVRNKYYWPGAAYTHWVGVDAYNGGCEQTWYGTFSEMVQKSVEWAAANAPDLPMMLPEWGATEGSTTRAKADFFRAVPAALTQPGFERIKAILYWNEGESGCNFAITSSQPSYDAYKELGHHTVMTATVSPR
jgi:hypothetical protein